MIAAVSRGMAIIPSGVIVSPRSRIAPLEGVRWWTVSHVVCGVSSIRQIPTGVTRSINFRPVWTSLPAFRRKFRSGRGLLRPLIIGSILSDLQNQRRDLARGGNCGFSKTPATSEQNPDRLTLGLSRFPAILVLLKWDNTIRGGGPLHLGHSTALSAFPPQECACDLPHNGYTST